MLVLRAHLEKILDRLYEEKVADSCFLNRERINAHALFLCGGGDDHLLASQKREAAHHFIRKGIGEVLLSTDEGKFCSTRRSMNNLLSRPDQDPVTSTRLPPVRRSRARLLGWFFSLFTGLVILLAFGSGVLLLVKDTPWSLLQYLAHAPISALPLLLIGLASLCFQVVIRPTPLDLFKGGLVSSAFLLWGIDQLLPTGWEATTLGDIVIVLYVIDLGWMMGDRLKGRHKLVRQETQLMPVQSARCLHLLPSSPDTHPPELLPLSDLAMWQREPSPGDPNFLSESTGSSSVFKRHRLVPLHRADRQ